MTTFYRTSNQNADEHVTKLEPFKGSNTWGEWIKNMYVVFSYGHHFPIYAYDTDAGIWFGNKDKYSRSTTRHQSQLRPNADRIEYLDKNDMINLVSCGSLSDWTIEKARS